MTTIGEKVAYVKGQGQSRDHHCHWPGCPEQVPPAKWGCAKHWFKLPRDLRDRIWRTFKPGQEVNGTPSTEYIAAARAAQEWIKANTEPSAQLQLGEQPHAPAPAARNGVALLIDGRRVSSYSEEWRHECEARHVANLPDLAARRVYLDKVTAVRGEAAGQRLQSLANQILAAGRRSLP